MATRNYKSYESAYKTGGHDVWPGCGVRGRCMPCGRIHDFGYSENWAPRDKPRNWISRFQCAVNHRSGCPNPKPEPEHKFNNHGICSRCGASQGWITKEGKWFATIKQAQEKGYQRKELNRPNKDPEKANVIL